MKSKDEILAVLRAHKEDLARRYHVRSLLLFGSRARGDATESSDIDLVVEFDAPVGMEFIDLADELEALLGERVDLVSRPAIKDRHWRVIQGDLVHV